METGALARVPLLGRLAPRLRLLVVGAALTFLLYVVIGFLVVPWVVRGQIERRALSVLHRQATVAKVRTNPFTWETRIIGFDLRDRDATPLLAFDTMVVNISLASIPRRALVLDEFRIIRPAATARVLQDGELAIGDLFQADSTGPPPPDTVRTPPPRLEVRHLAIHHGEINYIDETGTPRYEEHFRDLGLTVDGLSTLPNETGDHVLTVSFAGGAQIRWTGRNVVEPLNLEGEFQLTGVRLWKLAEVFGRDLPMRLTEGTGAATFRYALTQSPGQGLVLTVPSGEAHLTGLTVRPQGLEEDWLRVPTVDLEGATLEWPRRAATIQQVRISDPWVAAARHRNGDLNWRSHLERRAALGDTGITAVPLEAPADSNPAWDVTVGTLELTGGSAIITDQVPRPAVRYDVSGVTVRLSPVATNPATPTAIEAAATIGKRATLSASGTATREPFAADLAVKASNLDLRLLRPYLGASPPANIVAGSASVEGKVKARDTKPKLVFQGQAGIARFALNDSAGDSLLSWRSMKASGIHYTATPDLVRIRKVALDEPFARVAISKEKTINLMALTTMLPADTTKETPYEILEVDIDDARIDFSDDGLIIPFRTTIDSAYGSIKDIASFGGTPGTLELEGKVEEYGIARASGSLRLNDPYAATDIKADFRNLNMVSLTPYSATFAGYAITKGKLDVAMDYQVRDRQLVASHKIVATDLTLGDKVEGGESPGFLVKLAISLMKDKEGRIKLDVPVEGTVDDPEFSYKGIVWQALKQMLGKIATAPFRFLGKLLGIGGDDVELVDFDPGRTDIIPPERQKLDSLIAEMGRKPELTLAVEGRYDSISDVKAIRSIKLEKRIQAERDSMGKKAQSDTSTSRLARILEKLYVADHGEGAFDSLRDAFKEAAKADSTKKGRKYDAGPFYAEVRDQLEAAEPVEPGELERLGKDRAQAILTALTSSGTLESSRVVATEPMPVKKKKAGSSRIPSEMTMDAK
jgi:hypothetical protein